MVDVLPRFGLHNAAARGADRGHVEVTVALPVGQIQYFCFETWKSDWLVAEYW